MRKTSLQFLLILVISFASHSYSKACHGLALLNFSCSTNGNSVTINGSSNPATCGCGPYYMEVEIRCFSSANFTGLAPACNGTWNVYPWFRSMLNIPNPWSDNCVLEAYVPITIPFSVLCAGTQYVLRARERLCGNMSTGPWSSNYTFTTPGTAPTFILSATSTPSSVCIGTSVTLAAVLTGSGGCGTGLPTFTWTPGNLIGQSVIVTPSSTTTYTVTVSGGYIACYPVPPVPVTVTVNAMPTATISSINVLCFGGNTGSATVTPSPVGVYTYLWSPSGGTSQTATGLSVGTYSVTCTGAGGCVVTQTVTITQPPVLAATLSQVNIVCNGGNTGSATVTMSGGVPPYTYLWSPSGGTAATATGLAAGNYTCTTTDANGCTFTSTFTLTQSPPITATQSQVNNDCFGVCHGTATVVASGGTGIYTYLWSPTGGTAPTAGGLCAGSFTCTISSPLGCTFASVFVITDPPAIAAVASQVDVDCFGACNGSATVVASGGLGNYTYVWAPSGGTAATATGLCVGTYTCTISSPIGCTLTQSFNIIEPPVITATQSQVDVDCFGACNGTATVVAAGGTGNYTYAWAPSGGTAATATGLCAGTYTCTISSPIGCTLTQTFNIIQPPVITATQSQVNLVCFASCIGTATVVAAGGTGNFTYVWSPSGGTAATATALCAGSYTCTISSPIGCTLTQTFNITEPPVIAALPSQVNVDCFGSCNGTATVVASGGTGIFTYAWTPSGGTAATATGLCAGMYTCTISSPIGCTLTQSFNITQPPVITAIASQVNVNCFGSCNGTATVVAAGGTGIYTYAWTPSGGTAATATGLCIGTYTCTISSPNGCTLTQSFNITQPPVITAVLSQVNVACFGSCTATATVVASGGLGNYTYSWSPSGGTAATASSLCVGTYTCTISSPVGCTLTQSFSITQPPALSSINTQVNVVCNGIPTGVATVNASGGVGPYTYAWAPSGGNAATATGLAAGSYTCTITDFNGCTLTQSFTILSTSLIALVTSTTPSLCGSPTGTASVVATGGVGPYTYLWSPSGGNAAVATGLLGGVYTVTVTDANGCIAVSTVNVIGATTLSAVIGSSTSILCFGGNNGNATVTASGGNSPYTYSWSPTGGIAAIAVGLIAGTYTVTVTDANSCVTTDTITITEPPLLTSSIVSTNLTCNGNNSGTAAVTALGGNPSYTYSWSPSGGNAALASALSAQSYTCTITDANGCFTTSSITLTEPTLLTAVSSQVNVLCNGANTGSATVVASGGVPTYMYSWTPTGGTAATASSLLAGSYTCTITDANGCIITQTFVITEPPALVASAGQLTQVACFGQATGVINVLQVGGVGPYTYIWSPNISSSNSAASLLAGVYQITVSDANGCASTTTITITEPPLLTLTATAAPTALCSGQPSVLNANPVGGTPTYAVVWMPGNLIGNSQNITPVATATYSATVTDANGCIANVTTTVIVNPVPVAAFSGDVLSGCAPICVNFTDLSNVANPGNITSWDWDFGDGNISNLQNPLHCYTTAGVFNVILTVKTSDGCIHTITMPNYISVFVIPVAAFSANPQPTTIFNPQIYFTDLSTYAATWNWSFGDVQNSSSTLQNPDFTYLAPFCYQVLLSITSQDGCTDTVSHPVCINPDVSIYLPNAFSPNGDYVNDVFIPVGFGIDPDKFQMLIFDRWGNFVFSTDDLNTGWDGTVIGKPGVCQIDSYVWRIIASDINGGTHRLIGSVLLLK